MHKYCLSLLLLAALAIAGALPARSQNLVPNYSFENYNACPTGLSAIVPSATYSSFPYVPGWVSASTASPDYFNSCNTGTVIGVPVNSWGYQYPHTGNAYTGGYMRYHSATNQVNTYTENIEAQLAQPMIAGHSYQVQFYCVSSAHSQAQPYGNTLVGVDKIGGVLTTQQINGATSMPLNYMASVSSPAGVPLTDTADWVRVSGMYTAAGGEQWLTLGRFEDGLPVTEAVIIPGIGGMYSSNYAYYYFDDVMVKDVEKPDVVNVHNITLCTAAGTTLSGPAPADEYSWSNGSSSPSIIINTPGTWWVRAWKDTLYSVDTFDVSIATPAPLHLPADTILCNAASYTIAPNFTYSTYLWSTGAVSPSITVSQPGQYILTVTDACGIQKDTINVLARQLLHLANDAVICYGKTLTVAANYAYSSYAWSTGATTASTALSQSGQYILSVTDACGVQKDTIGLTIRAAVPPPLPRDTMLCLGVIGVHLQVTGDSLRWYSNPTGTGAFAQPAINTANAGSQTLYVSQTKDGCESSRQAVTIGVIAAPTVALGPDTTLCKGAVLLIGGHYSTGTTLHWSTGQSLSPLPVSAPAYYELTAANSCGTAADGIFVSFVDCDSNGHPYVFPPIRHDCLFMPTAFTPNNDRRNERFTVGSHCPLERYSIRIYNRWGGLVYESHDINTPWDGTLRGKPAAADTYFYVISYLVAASGNVYDMMKGDVLLIR